MPHILEALIVSMEEKTDDDIKSQVGDKTCIRHTWINSEGQKHQFND